MWTFLEITLILSLYSYEKKEKFLVKTFFEITLHNLEMQYFVLNIRAGSFRLPPPLHTFLLSCGYVYVTKYEVTFERGF